MLKSKIVLKRSKVVYKDLSSDGVVGYAYKDENNENRIEIDPNQCDSEFFLSYGHELGHNLLPDLSEKQIIKFEQTFCRDMLKAVMRLKRKWRKEWEKKHCIE